VEARVGVGQKVGLVNLDVGWGKKEKNLDIKTKDAPDDHKSF
jgi:hypothetical protein